METALITIFVAAAIIAVLIDCIVFFVNLQRSESHLSRLVALAVLFVLAGLIAGAGRLIGYMLVSVGGILAMADLWSRSRRGRQAG